MCVKKLPKRQKNRYKFDVEKIEVKMDNAAAIYAVVDFSLRLTICHMLAKDQIDGLTMPA